MDGAGHDGKTRLWLGGEVSEQRDMALIRGLSERVRRCAARRPLLICTDGVETLQRRSQGDGVIKTAYIVVRPVGRKEACAVKNGAVE